MLQVSQRLRDGRIEVVDVPSPVLQPEGVLVGLRTSLVSTGTERSKVRAGRQSLVGKARSRPDQVRKVVEKARRDGLGDTVAAVRSRLEQLNPLGYSAAGVVLEVGARVRGLAPGDRVACGGATATHAEVVQVPGNLCVPLPADVPFDAAAFATVGSVALHGVRQAEARLGERVAVIGLGLVGQICGQLLHAAGCEVVGIDLADSLVDAARRGGIFDAAVDRATLDRALPAHVSGCDAVVITAATSSSDPLDLAARLCRDRGRVVVVGDVRMDVDRSAYYDKELELRVSRSYGPGRYDREYEERGLDYPIGYVRWTERRNMLAFLQLLASGKIDVAPLIGERVRIGDAADAYSRLADGGSSTLGILIEYPGTSPERPPAAGARAVADAATRLSVGVIGAGSFATRIAIPALRDAGFDVAAVASATGLSASSAAARQGISRCARPDELISDGALGAIAVVTRHASHASLASQALRAGKAVFVEKPPAIDDRQLSDLRAARDETGLPLAVGFNRRFAPLAVELADFIRVDGVPIELLYRVNAGPLPLDHWLNDLEDGGGRLVGEGCHFVDFACWLVGGMPRRVTALTPVTAAEALPAAAQSFTVGLEFDDGSLATILYHAGGAAKVTKEYLEVHASGRSALLDDFRTLRLADERRVRTLRNRARDKGHVEQMGHFRRVVEGTAPSSPVDPLDSMLVTLGALRAATTGRAWCFGEDHD